MKTNVNLKFKMGAALMVMSLGFGLAGAVNTAQAKDVVLKEFPKKFRGNWVGNEESAPFTIDREGIGRDGSCIQIVKLIADSANANKLTVVYRDTGMDCDDTRAPIEKSVYLLKNGALTVIEGGKTWGPFHRVKW